VIPQLSLPLKINCHKEELQSNIGFPMVIKSGVFTFILSMKR